MIVEGRVVRLGRVSTQTDPRQQSADSDINQPADCAAGLTGSQVDVTRTPSRCNRLAIVSTCASLLSKVAVWATAKSMNF